MILNALLRNSTDHTSVPQLDNYPIIYDKIKNH